MWDGAFVDRPFPDKYETYLARNDLGHNMGKYILYPYKYEEVTQDTT